MKECHAPRPAPPLVLAPSNPCLNRTSRFPHGPRPSPIKMFRHLFLDGVLSAASRQKSFRPTLLPIALIVSSSWPLPSERDPTARFRVEAPKEKPITHNVFGNKFRKQRHAQNGR